MPRAALTRLLYELMGTLHWPGAPPLATTLTGDAFAQLMIGRDELLRLEANMTAREADEQLALALGVLELGPDDAEAHTLLLDFAARLLASADGDVLGDALRRAAEQVLGACVELDDRTAAFLDGVAGLLASLGMAAAARLVTSPAALVSGRLRVKTLSARTTE